MTRKILRKIFDFLSDSNPGTLWEALYKAWEYNIFCSNLGHKYGSIRDTKVQNVLKWPHSNVDLHDYIEE